MDTVYSLQVFNRTVNQKGMAATRANMCVGSIKATSLLISLLGSTVKISAKSVMAVDANPLLSRG